MLHLIYSAGLWICFDFRIYQSCEYTRAMNKSVLYKVLNKIFHDRCLTVSWICLGYWICQGYTWFWIKFSIKYIWLGSEYASSSEYASVTQDSVENGPSCCSGSQYVRAWIYKGCEYFRFTQGSVWTVF